MRNGFFPSFIFRFFLGGIFVFSAYSKLFPVEPFEYTLVQQGLSNWFFSPFLSRGIIGFEFLLGVFILLNIRFKTFTLKSTVGLLVFFTIYLVYALLRYGNEIDCGCFGNILSMTPVQSIVKNVGLVGLCLVCAKLDNPGQLNNKWLFGVLGLVSMALPFILYPPEVYSSTSRTNIEAEKFNVSLLDSLGRSADPAVDITRGKQLVAFFSLKCSHCRLANQKLGVLRQEDKVPPVTIVFNGDSTRVETFFKRSNTRFPYIVFNDERFGDFIGPVLPSLVWLEDGKPLYRWYGDSFNPLELEALYRED